MTTLERAPAALRSGHPPLERSRSALVVEDDEMVAFIVSRYLLREGFRVETVGDAMTALARTATDLPDVIVLDVSLPGLDGLEACRRWRTGSDVPIIIISGRGEELDRVRGLDCGADDYLTKPFSPRELMARIRSVLRRSAPFEADRPLPVLQAGAIALDQQARVLTVAGRPVETTAREFDLLAYFLRHPGRALDRATLLREVWGFSFGATATVTVHVRRLREKIEQDPAAPRHIRTVWGIGYRFEP